MQLLSIGNCDLLEHLGSGRTRLRWRDGLREAGWAVDSFEPRDFMRGYQQPRFKTIRMAFAALTFVRRRVGNGHYDIVECFGGEMALAQRWVLAHRPGSKVVHHSDGLELVAYFGGKLPGDPGAPKGPGRRMAHRIHHLAALKSHHLVVGAESDREFAIDRGLVDATRVDVVSPGIDDAFFSTAASPNADTKRVAFVGTWIARKDPTTVMKVMREVLCDEEAEFHVFGAAESASEIRAALPADHASRTIIHPRLTADELAPALRTCSVFLLPSRYEGFGMATAEACLCGCAPVVTPTGLGSSLRSRGLGEVVDFGDSDAMIAAIRRLLDSPEERRRVQAETLTYVQGLRWPTQVASLDRIYRGIINADLPIA